jgi:hypothetical protein
MLRAWRGRLAVRRRLLLLAEEASGVHASRRVLQVCGLHHQLRIIEGWYG